MPADAADGERPSAFEPRDVAPIEAFVAALQNAIDTGDADLFNGSFAADVLWGTPFAAIAEGYDQIHPIHVRMFSSVDPLPGAARYELEHARFVSDDVAVAYVRRLAQAPPPAGARTTPGGFDELALFVLVKRDDRWWLAAAQHVPDRRDVYAAIAPSP